MNRGRGRGRGRERPKYPSPQSSSNLQLSPRTPVQSGASFNDRQMSGSMDGNSKHSWQVKQRSSVEVVSEFNDNVIPVGRRDQARFGSYSDQHRSDSGHRKQYSSWKQVRGHNSDGVLPRNNERVTSAGYQGEQQESSTFRGYHSFRGRREQFRPSSNPNVSSIHNINHDDQSRLLHVESKADTKLDRSLVESVDHLANVSSQSLSVSGVEILDSTENTHGIKNNEHADCSSLVEAFDICPPKSNTVVTLKSSLLAKNKEKRTELKNSIDGPNGVILRSGMVLLKRYLSIAEQASILKICHKHGLGPAGFYQPLFREGAKLHLKMMCFGQFWDPETSKYGDVRPIDRAKPPSVPSEFLLFVDRAIKDSQSLIAENSGVKNVEKLLPSVKPDICLVNYYATTGRLGLHQDKDEGQESLNKGIPIVSLSIGDTAEFLYGDERDADKAEKIMLESGDVLIFGGKSRHIFHGVSAIKPNTSPKSLLEETNFRAGRLNLTFRQHL